MTPENVDRVAESHLGRGEPVAELGIGENPLPGG
jgi:(2Fe-2S) ferredoxin